MPSRYNEEDDTETMYDDANYPYVVRDQGQSPVGDLCVDVLADIADIAEEMNLACAPQARVDATRAAAELAAGLYSDEYDDMADWIFDTSFYPPYGIDVDWDGHMGTVTVTASDGWVSA